MSSLFSYDGTELYYDIIGMRDDAAPIVVHAGGPARHPEYLGNLGGLDLIRPLLMLHQRGVGQSQAPVDPQTGWWPSLADDLEALRKHLGLPQLDLLGHSAGARVAMSYAARYPYQVSRLCLVAPPATWLVDVESDVAALAERRCDEPWFSAVRSALEVMAEARTGVERIELSKIIAPISYAHWDDTTRTHAQLGESYPDALEAFFDQPSHAEPIHQMIRPALQVLQAPVLIIAGAQDVMTGLRPVVALADIFQNGRTVVIENCGHFPWVEQPDQFMDEVGSFFFDEA